MHTLLLLLIFGGVAATQTVPPGMTRYTVGFLRAVPNRPDLPKEEAERIQAQHLAHMGRLAEAGELLAAGPIGTPGPLRGILIYRTSSLEKAREMTAADPAVIHGRLTVDVHAWLGPAGIGAQYAAKMKEIPKPKARMLKYRLVALAQGPAWTSQPVPENAKIMQSHLDRVARLRQDGRMLLGGPFVGTVGGIFVFRDGDDACALAAEDPLVQSGGLTIEGVYDWYCAEWVLPESR